MDREEYGYIYKITNLVNGKVYIGQTIRTVEIRLQSHLSSAKKEDYVLYRAMRKYGAGKFEVQTIDVAKSKIELNEKEIYWIEKYRSFVGFLDCNGYNMTLGGEGTRGGIILTLDNVIKIKEMLRDTNLSCKEIGKIFKTSGRNVSSIHEGRSYSYIIVDGHVPKTKRDSGMRGEKYPHTDLSSEDVVKMKKIFRDTDLEYNDIANMFNTSTIVVGKIYRGERWSWLNVDGFTPKMKRNNKFKKSKKNKKLTDKEAREIKTMLLDKNVKQDEIAEKYNVSRTIVTNIATEKRYKHIIVKGFIPNKTGRVSSSLGEESVIEIKRKSMTGKYSSKELSEHYNISLTGLWDILNEKNYKNVKLEGYCLEKVLLKSKKEKLNKESVNKIRELKEIRSIKELSSMFGVSERTIKDVCEYKTWKKIKG